MPNKARAKLPPRNKYYVYELIDPRDGEVFYIGKGRNYRLYGHEKEAKKGKDSRKCTVIREILAAGKSIRYRIVKEFFSENEAYLFEEAHINAVGLDKLTNEIPGGAFPAKPMPPLDIATAKGNGPVLLKLYGVVWLARNKGKRFGFGPREDWVDLTDHFCRAFDGIIERMGWEKFSKACEPYLSTPLYIPVRR